MEGVGIPAVGRNGYDTRATVLEELVKCAQIE
jgi:hypothetical protein